MEIACGFEPAIIETRHIDSAPATKVQSVETHTTKPHLNSAKPLSSKHPVSIKDQDEDLDDWVSFLFRVYLEQRCLSSRVYTDVTVYGVLDQDDRLAKDEMCSKTFISPGEIALHGGFFSVEVEGDEVDCEYPRSHRSMPRN
jgi:hypothetical protein